MPDEHIVISGAKQNNLKDLNLKLPLGELIVITGVSGSGKSSLAFDTVYSEGQRRYVETFSPYARQFLERMDKPKVERIDGIPPSIAIDQTNPVRTSRSTVGTMTELNDHIKLLFARAATLFCGSCATPVRQDNAESIFTQLLELDTQTATPRIAITFGVTTPANFSAEEVEKFLRKLGYTQFLSTTESDYEVIQDRVRLSSKNRARIIESLEAALSRGQGRVCIATLNDDGNVISRRDFSANLHCASCNRHYREPTPSAFSFNSPVGACDACRGFGRVMGIDPSLVVPDESLTLAKGAIKPWQSESYAECQRDLLRFAKRRGIATDKPWAKLSKSDRRWVFDGEGAWNKTTWYGVNRFFEWLETKSYRMHIRVLLSKYRSYEPCPQCEGARLKPDSLCWRLGDLKTSSAADEPPPGLNVSGVCALSLRECLEFFTSLTLPKPLDEATDLLLPEIRSRLNFLVNVGLGYLTLDRQSRTLSGGEVQRINLTTALGTSLVNTLFVLDEPSIGLHARDMTRIVGILHKLRDAGNTLLVVEHDAQIMLSANRILDIGPGPGEHGGEVIFNGSPSALLRSKKSLTAQYLNGTKRVVRLGKAATPKVSTKFLTIVGARENNLRGIDVSIPLNRLVCITGVSGSGKSTLVEDVCYRALSKLKGKSLGTPGKHTRLRGAQHVAEVVMVDQAPIGRTTRSNPASYVGALEGIRKAFADEPLSVERGYKAGTFSFNSGDGRCPTCGGNGFEHVEMQFLSDVYLRCADCDGDRYRPEVLEVKLLASDTTEQPRSIAQVLDLTITQATRFFANSADVLQALEPLELVGLGYLKLGQPVPGLSGGEAQRLKLAGHIAKSRKKKSREHKLFLFDEPTTGLHFDDISTLLNAFDHLLDDGHSVVVIEHNLDVIDTADWVIDLGPEGGTDGGALMFEGTPDALVKCATSFTGRALAEQQKAAHQRISGIPPTKTKRSSRSKQISIRNAREHNLRNVDIDIPTDKFTVITGISGSGKSTVAFDILFAEGQRRYLESLNAYARQFVQPATRPELDAIFGIPPTVAIEQRTSRGGRKSTVATMTEIYHFLRLLLVKLGTQYCPACDVAIEPQSPQAVRAAIMRAFKGERITLLAPLIVARKGYYTDLAAWAGAKGATHLRVDGELLPTANWPRLDRFKEHNIEWPLAELDVDPKHERALADLLERALALGKGVVHISPVSKNGNPSARSSTKTREVIYSTKRACPSCDRSFAELDPRLFSFNSKHGWCSTCFGTGLKLKDFDAEQSGEENTWLDDYNATEQPCKACAGQRLRPEALAVRFKDANIHSLTSQSVADARDYFSRLRLSGRDAQIARDILSELGSRLTFLEEVGLGYLGLERAAPTLSGGEAQRIRLAAQLGSNLRGVCYILDEPTIGLHARDNAMLLATLSGLSKKGNSVVVVEHDEDTIRSAEHIIDLGPGAGVNGGEVVATGDLAHVMKNKRSLTGRFLAQPLCHPLAKPQINELDIAPRAEGSIRIEGACLNNLRGLNVEIPLGSLTCVTGVSGSGKSTLIREVVHKNVSELIARKKSRASALHGCKTFSGFDSIGRILEVDQTPIGKTPRSCPATYIGVWDQVRKLFAETPQARMRGFTAGRFSFNVGGGRCDACEGQGVRKIEMNFLPDVRVVCDSCFGARFNTETLSVTYKEKNVAEVLAMNVDQAIEFFEAHVWLHRTLRLLHDVGLGYLTLGQQSSSLSGGEAQRIKLVSELSKWRPQPAQVNKKNGTSRTPKHTLYILDEPTVGLHMADVEKLIMVLHRLVLSGNTVIVIEHNLDVVAEADWVIDLGPEGGAGGGRIVAQGAVKTIVKRKSHTAKALASFLGGRQAQPVQ